MGRTIMDKIIKRIRKSYRKISVRFWYTIGTLLLYCVYPFTKTYEDFNAAVVKLDIERYEALKKIKGLKKTKLNN